MSDWIYDLEFSILYPLVVLTNCAAAFVGLWLGQRSRRDDKGQEDLGMLAGAVLGMFALLLAFSFSLALSRFDTRRAMVLEEANAIGSTANFALMLPTSAREPVLDLLREYTAVRIGLGTPFDPTKMDRDVARSVDLQARMWSIAVAVTSDAPQSLPVYRFVGSLNEINNIHERRVTALRYRIPGEVMVMLLGIALVSIALAAYHSGARGAAWPIATLLMAVTASVVMTMVVDLDRPARGFITVPVQPLLEAAQGIPR